jgi:hypothetical protein
MLQRYGMTGTTRSSAGLDARRRRLLYGCCIEAPGSSRLAGATIGTLSETESACSID